MGNHQTSANKSSLMISSSKAHEISGDASLTTGNDTNSAENDLAALVADLSNVCYANDSPPLFPRRHRRRLLSTPSRSILLNHSSNSSFGSSNRNGIKRSSSVKFSKLQIMEFNAEHSPDGSEHGTPILDGIKSWFVGKDGDDVSPLLLSSSRSSSPTSAVVEIYLSDYEDFKNGESDVLNTSNGAPLHFSSSTSSLSYCEDEDSDDDEFSYMYQDMYESKYKKRRAVSLNGNNAGVLSGRRSMNNFNGKYGIEAPAWLQCCENNGSGHPCPPVGVINRVGGKTDGNLSNSSSIVGNTSAVTSDSVTSNAVVGQVDTAEIIKINGRTVIGGRLLF